MTSRELEQAAHWLERYMDYMREQEEHEWLKVLDDVYSQLQYDADVALMEERALKGLPAPLAESAAAFGRAIDEFQQKVIDAMPPAGGKAGRYSLELSPTPGTYVDPDTGELCRIKR